VNRSLTYGALPVMVRCSRTQRLRVYEMLSQDIAFRQQNKLKFYSLVYIVYLLIDFYPSAAATVIASDWSRSA
jgi:hypothetical protein